MYALSDPRTGAVRYVGWAFDPESRFRVHLRRRNQERTHKAHWISSVVDAGFVPALSILETGTGDWAEAERRWIAAYRADGARLTNATDGGEGTPGLHPSKETRARMSEVHKGRRHSPEVIEKLAAKLRGRKQSPAHVAALARVRKGKVPHAATAAAVLKVRGSKQSQEHVEKRIAPLRGRVRAAYRMNPTVIGDVEHWPCAACKAAKPAALFVKNASSWSGIMRICKACHAERQSQYRKRA